MDNNWRDSLPDEIKGSEALANFEDVSALAQGFIEAKTYQGSSIRIPGEDAGDEDRKIFNEKMLEKMPTLMYKPDFENPEQSQEFYRTLGMPETADKYTFPEIEPPEGVELQTEKLEGFREIAHKHGLTAAQFKGIMADVVTGDIATAQADIESIAANMTAIKEKFGEAFKDNMGKINTLLTRTGAPESLIEAAGNGMVNLETIDWLYQMGKQMGGEGFDFKGELDTNTSDAKMTPDEALAAIDEINRNKEHPYWKGTGDEKKRATEHMIMLMKFAHPERAA